MLFLLLPFACSEEPAAPPPPPPDAPKVETMLGEVPGIQYIGEWTSKDCPGRTYPRNIVIREDHTYAGVDLVAPCPKGTPCVWSGLVGFAGIWKQEGTRLLLREIGGPIEKGSPHPTEFTATMDGHLEENGCKYDRGLFVPPGYSEDEVRPKVPGTGSVVAPTPETPVPPAP